MALSVSLILTACGGGGSSSSTTNTPSANSGSTSSGATSTGSTSTGSSGSSTSASHFLYTTAMNRTGPTPDTITGTTSGTTIYAIGAKGVLSSTSSVNVNADGLYIDPTGKFAYIPVHNLGSTLTSNETLNQYAVNADGSLSPLSVPTISTHFLSGWAIHIVFDPLGKFAYVTGTINNSTDPLTLSNIRDVIETYAVGSNGSLSLISTTMEPHGTHVSDIAVNPITNTVYTVRLNQTPYGTTTVNAYSIGSKGALAAIGSPLTFNASGRGIAIDPAGKFAYIIADITSSDSLVYEYTVASNGALTPMTTPSVSAGNIPMQMAIDPSGKYAYVINLASNNISQFTIGANGRLSPMAMPIVTAIEPNFIGLDPAGGSIYVGSVSTGNITSYAIGSNGSLTVGATTHISNTTYGSVTFITTH